MGAYGAGQVLSFLGWAAPPAGDLVLPRAAADGTLMRRWSSRCWRWLSPAPARGDPEANQKSSSISTTRPSTRRTSTRARNISGPRISSIIRPRPTVSKGFKRLITFLKEKFPKLAQRDQTGIAEGDIVVLHLHSVRETRPRGRAIVDMFPARETARSSRLGRHPESPRTGQRQTMF